MQAEAIDSATVALEVVPDSFEIGLWRSKATFTSEEGRRLCPMKSHGLHVVILGALLSNVALALAIATVERLPVSIYWRRWRNVVGMTWKIWVSHCHSYRHVPSPYYR